MKRKTTKEIKKIVKDIYGEDMKLIRMNETREVGSKDMLWDDLIFMNNKTKERIEISFIDFEDIGYITEEYNKLGDTTSSCERWNELDKRLEEEKEKEEDF